MPYANGTAVNITALHNAINNFADANGFSILGDVIYSANSWTKLYETTGEIITLSGAASTDMLTDPGPATASIRIPSASFPVYYELFTHGASGDNANPLSLVCVVKYATDTHTWLTFGEFRKTNPSMTGGSYFASMYREAALGSSTVGLPMDEVNKVQMTAINGGTNAFNSNAHSGGLFWNSQSGTPPKSILNSFARCTFDGDKWPYAKCNLLLRPLLERQPNLWNGQTVLQPVKLCTSAADNMELILGTLPFVRLLRIDNYNSGDIITYGTDKWKVFPFWKKDTINRNGLLDPFSNGSCGTFGWAIKYDGA